MLSSQVVDFIWHGKSPPRAQLLLWFLVQDKLKTDQVLYSRGLLTDVQALCPFCSDQIESSSHLFFTCMFTWQLWASIFDWWGMCMPLQAHPVEVLISWDDFIQGCHKNAFKRKLWNSMFFVIIWSILYMV